MALCQVVPAPDAFASGMMAFLDCQAATLGAGGYRALAATGSTASVVLAALLTIFVALIGYRMLFGETPTMRDSVLALVKVGAVLALATGWPAYQTLVYDVTLRAPAELAGEIGGAAGLPGASGGLPGRLDDVDRAFQALAIYGVGVPPFDPAGQVVQERRVPPMFAGFDTFALGTARAVFLTSALGGFAVVRLAVGLLLGLGPLFLGFLLFDATRGLFEGWMRALIATALGALSTAIVIGVELALFEPWLADLVARRSAGDTIIGVPAPLLAASVIFAVTLAGVLLMIGRVGMALRLSTTLRISLSGGTVARAEGVSAPADFGQNITTRSTEPRSRATAIAHGIAASQRREEHQFTMSSTIAATNSGTSGNSPVSGGAASTSVERIGQASRRRTTSRLSASAGARDRRA